LVLEDVTVYRIVYSALPFTGKSECSQQVIREIADEESTIEASETNSSNLGGSTAVHE
jgi:hypothetical protein